MRSRRWIWLNGSLIGLARATVRVCWLFPCVELLSYRLLGLDRPLIPPWLMALILLAGWMLAFLFVQSELAAGQSGQPRAQRVGLRERRLVIAGLGLGLLLWLVWWRLYRPDFTLWNRGWVAQLVRALTRGQGMSLPLSVMLIGAYLWWRGLSDGSMPPWHGALFGTFVVGLAWLVGLAVLSHYQPTLRPPSLWPAALAFVISSLAALALVDLDEVRRRGGAAAHDLLTINRYWLFTTLTSIGLITALGLALTTIAAPLRIAALLDAFTSFLDLLSGFLVPVILHLVEAIAYLVFLILSPLIRFLRGLLRQEMPAPDQQSLDARSAWEFPQPAGARPQAMPWLDAMARAAFLILLVGGMGLAFVVALRRYVRRSEDGVEETRELIWSADLMRDEWHALVQRLRRGRRRDGQQGPAFLSLRGVEADRRRVRQVYQQLLARAGDQGLPRPPGATPHEYGAALNDRYAAPEWRTITDAYIRARYAAVPLSPSLASQVEADWQKLSHGWQEAQGSAARLAERVGQEPSQPTRRRR
jgi:hypothetical protein